MEILHRFELGRYYIAKKNIYHAIICFYNILIIRRIDMIDAFF